MNISDIIGNTPLVEIKKTVSQSGVEVLGKLEGHNPGGSVKDRAAYGMIKGAVQSGRIQAGTRLVEATSGNTGIALAMMARQFEVPITLIMPDNSTAERPARRMTSIRISISPAK
jgi:cysteine synthase B